MAKNNFYVLIFLIFLDLTLSQTVPKIVDPFHHKEIEGVVLYEKSGHVQFSVATYLTPSSPIFTSEPYPACTSVGSGPVCSLLYYLGEIEKEIRTMVTTEQTQRKTESFQKPLKSDCGEISQIFPSLYTDVSLFNTAGPDALSKCFNQTFINEPINYSSPFFQFYTDSQREFDRNYTNSTGLDTSVARMGTMIVQEVLNIGGFLHHFAYKTRWEDAVNRCKFQKVLPPSLVTSEVLQKVLSTFEERIKDKGYQLAIPIDNQTISTYWNIPTVDCTFSNNSANFSILMGIPIKKTGSDWSLHKLTVVPFHRRFNNVNYVCYVTGAEEDQEYYKFDKTTNATYKSDGDVTSFLKYSPTATPRRFFKPVSKTVSCSKTVISGGGSADPLDIVRNCPLTCTREEEIEDGGDGFVVQMISSDKFYVTKAREAVSQVTLECTGTNRTANLPANGALLVTAGCGCKLNLKEMTYEVGIPCEERDSITADEVIPVHFQTTFARNSNTIYMS